jgi:hypothetical protein
LLSNMLLVVNLVVNKGLEVYNRKVERYSTLRFFSATIYYQNLRGKEGSK